MYQVYMAIEGRVYDGAIYNTAEEAQAEVARLSVKGQFDSVWWEEIE